MAGLTAKTPSATYKDLLKIENSNSGIDETLRQIESGSGVGSALYIEKNSTKIVPVADDTALLDVQNAAGSSKFKVDSEGNVTASNVQLTGIISSSEGSIGGWKINSSSL